MSELNYLLQTMTGIGLIIIIVTIILNVALIICFFVMCHNVEKIKKTTEQLLKSQEQLQKNLILAINSIKKDTAKSPDR